MSTPAPGEFRDQPREFTVLERELRHHGWVWNIVGETADYGGTPLHREFMDHTGSVAIMAIDEDDRVLFIEQYRHPVRSRNWELPAGLLDDPSEDPLTTAKRELAEEADYRADDWSVLLDFWTSPGGSNESIRIYLARGLTALDETFAREHEEADIRVAWVPLEAALDAVMSGNLHNPASLQAIFAANEARRRDWSTLRPVDSPWPTRPDPFDVVPKALARGARA